MWPPSVKLTNCERSLSFHRPLATDIWHYGATFVEWKWAETNARWRKWNVKKMFLDQKRRAMMQRKRIKCKILVEINSNEKQYIIYGDEIITISTWLTSKVARELFIPTQERICYIQSVIMVFEQNESVPQFNSILHSMNIKFGKISYMHAGIEMTPKLEHIDMTHEREKVAGRWEHEVKASIFNFLSNSFNLMELPSCSQRTQLL